MSPITHLLGSWVIGATTTRNPRDCRLVTLAGALPDLDGAGLLVDGVDALLGRPVHFYYGAWHHVLLHGLAGGLLITGILTAFAHQRLRVLLLSLLVFHLHLVADFVGSRGPDPQDIWSIHYLAPLSMVPEWRWTHQWALDAWPNRVITALFMAAALWIPTQIGHSIVGVFHARADQTVVDILRGWRSALTRNAATRSGPDSRL